MRAGTAVIDITPHGNVWMDGMIRAHVSEGVHDPLHARALVLANSTELSEAFAVVSADVCAFSRITVDIVRQQVEAQTGIPASHIIIAATHTHSGPATMGYFNPVEEEYLTWLAERLCTLLLTATQQMHEVAVGCESGTEATISHYRRLLADDGHVVMNWEPYPPERIIGPLGMPDPEVGVLHVVSADDHSRTICLLFNHAGHPNVLSGDNYLLSAEYPGRAAQLLEARFGGVAIFVNGAQGTMDIDGLRDRDWEGMERIGNALADAVTGCVAMISLTTDARIAGASCTYTIPARRITDAEWSWASEILRQTGGVYQPQADGVGDDYLAVLFRELREKQEQPIPVEQSCFAIGDMAFLSFPCELYTEIGLRIKAASPFRHTYLLGLANGNIGYIPTCKAIGEGGYAENTRPVDESAEETIFAQSLALLHEVHSITLQGASR